MVRLSGPRGREIFETSQKLINDKFHDYIFNFIASMPKDERWLWGRTLEDEFTRMIEIMCYQLDIDDPRYPKLTLN